MPPFSNMKSPASDYESVVQVLKGSVRRHLTDGILLSGGLDSSILAYLISNWVKPSCITVALRDSPAPDIDYAKLVASRLGMRHYIHYFGNQELEEGFRTVIRVMKSFDPMEIRNSVAVYVGLKLARSKGISTIMTGDGGDELFAGYSFLFGLKKEQLDLELKKISANMRFSSTYLAESLGVEARLPFLDPQFKAFATGLDVSLKVKRERGQVWGKWILRKAFQNILPEEIVWRVKSPIETGTGTAILPSLFDSRISTTEFNEKKAKYYHEDRVVIRDKEHLFYYEIYRGELGAPYARDTNARMCPHCTSNVEEGTSFCRTCGAYPIR